MPRKPAKPITKKDIQGLKYLKAFEDILQPLGELPAHGNRNFRYDQWVSLLLLYFFNPVLTSLRALQQATGLENVQEATGVKRTSLGAMSDAAAHVFDPSILEPIIKDVAQRIEGMQPKFDRTDLPGAVVAVDGSFLRCLPKMAWAVFRTNSDKRGVKLHLHYDVQRGLPEDFEITEALGSEKKSLKKLLKAKRLYLLDRGYINYKLYQAVCEGNSFFIARLKENSTFEVAQTNPLTKEDSDAKVIADESVIMGSDFTEGHLNASVRRIVIKREDDSPVILLTNTELPAGIVAEMYRWRWQVELFFRWFKCILGCTHWLSQTRQGLTLQVYVALLASMLIRLWTDRKPTKRTFEMICLYFMGWASADELQRHIESLKIAQPKAGKNKTQK